MTEAATRHSDGGHALGTPCWASLMVHDLAAAQRFYQQLFGWEFAEGPQQLGAYVRGTLEHYPVAGLGEIATGRQLDVAWLPYLASPDADSTAASVRECGGTVAVGPLDAEEAGRMAIAADPTGAPFGVWQAGEHTGQALERGVPGTPVWFELIVRDSGYASAFYPTIFGYQAETSTREGTDTVTLRLADEPVAAVHGIGDSLPAGLGPRWKTYFAVADPDETARLAVELGGQLQESPAEVPFGRRATLTDPEGAEFSVVRLSG